MSASYPIKKIYLIPCEKGRSTYGTSNQLWSGIAAKRCTCGARRDHERGPSRCPCSARGTSACTRLIASCSETGFVPKWRTTDNWLLRSCIRATCIDLPHEQGRERNIGLRTPSIVRTKKRKCALQVHSIRPAFLSIQPRRPQHLIFTHIVSRSRCGLASEATAQCHMPSQHMKPGSS